MWSPRTPGSVALGRTPGFLHYLAVQTSTLQLVVLLAGISCEPEDLESRRNNRTLELPVRAANFYMALLLLRLCIFHFPLFATILNYHLHLEPGVFVLHDHVLDLAFRLLGKAVRQVVGGEEI